MNQIKKIKLFPNDNEYSLKVAGQVEEKLKAMGYELVKTGYELAIAIGGDGSFLRMIKNTQFDPNIYYIGINTGHLGFLQEIKPKNIDKFVSCLSHNQIRYDCIGIQKTTVTFQRKIETISSLNEIFIKEKELGVIRLKLIINGDEVENYVGDGMLICTSIGSTAHNLSYHGAIVHHNLHTLQITTQGALNNSVYRNVPNSIIVPETEKILLVPEVPSNFNIRIDGDNHFYEDVEYIKTEISEEKIKILRMYDYSLSKRINEKFIQEK